jgi:putative copper resistance protein D
MIEPGTALIVARALVFCTSAFVFGASALLVMFSNNALARPLWRTLKPWVSGASAILLAALILTLPIQSAIAGEGWSDATSPEILAALSLETAGGGAALVRIGLAALLVAGLTFMSRTSRDGPLQTASLSGLLVASFALTGHAALHDGSLGWLHRANHVLHVLAGCFWAGALIPLLLALRAERSAKARDDAAALLGGFSSAGFAAVGVVAVTGAINTALTLGRLPGDFASLYQKLLAAKIAVVVAMLLLAALNRLILAPRLHEHNETAMHCLRASIGSESVAAAAVLCLVAVFGTLEPI